MEKNADYIILHNARCRKSREGLTYLESMTESLKVIEYLKEPLDKTSLKKIIAKLDITAEQLLRKNEAVYREKYKGKSLTEDQWIDAMIENPKLIERPIVIKADKAIVARPASRISEL